MRINKEQYILARARACVGQKELEAAGVSRGTLYRVIMGGNVRPETVGKIAKTLGVDVKEIIE